ncbi:YqaA family protein [Magnetofaba australis]|uniref:Putative DedA family protein n=1 Tax=Magnetofaba australis IT-1 TaxID=1434232 RepID=A0A1Y2K2H4_9PROT|nr:YqaA family protein [Magnetofaba australis]OSM01857.1 putative DedA family protein [Magnetofaba australis IT-1]
MMRKLYDWTMHWAAHPNAKTALFLVAVAESSFFPIPPDLLLMAMTLAAPPQGLRYAAICTAGSVLGGALGYLIGVYGWAAIGEPIIQFYGKMDAYNQLVALFDEHGAWVVAIAGFSPIPYKLFTITAGALHADFAMFMAMSLFSRGARFFLVAGVLKWGGDRLRAMVEKHLDLLTIVIVVAVVGVVVIMKWLA